MRSINKVSFFIVFSCIICVSTNVLAQGPAFTQTSERQNHWVDSVFKRLNKKQKIAQLFMVRAHTNLGAAYEDSVAKVIKRQKLGGVVFFQGGPQREAVQINRYQHLAKVPLLIAMDGEWGLGMRLDSTTSYPYQMTLGAIQDNTLLYKMGLQVAQDFKRLGVQMNFGPDMDVNNNPNNPVIGFRSFGDNKYNVAEKGIAYMKGMQDGGILTTAKHFPGHGYTDVDSHFDLPQLPFTRQRLDSLEEYPFREAIKAGVSGVMVAHMNIPALDTTKHLPSTLSKPIITGILRDSLGFKGLIVSDAMGMKGVVKYFPDGEADVRALIAGNDVLELSENSKRAIRKIKKAIRKGKISMSDIDAHVKKVLTAKYWAGLNNRTAIPTQHLYEDLNRADARLFIQQLTDAAVTVLRKDSVTIDRNKTIAIISFGTTDTTVYQRELQKSFSNSRLFSIAKTDSADKLDSLLQILQSYNQVIIGIHDMRARPASKLDFDVHLKLMIQALAARPNSIVSIFANAYTVNDLPAIGKSHVLIMGYQKSDEMQRSAVKVITGQLKATGKVPVNISVSGY